MAPCLAQHVYLHVACCGSPWHFCFQASPEREAEGVPMIVKLRRGLRASKHEVFKKSKSWYVFSVILQGWQNMCLGKKTRWRKFAHATCPLTMFQASNPKAGLPRIEFLKAMLYFWFGSCRDMQGDDGMRRWPESNTRLIRSRNISNLIFVITPEIQHGTACYSWGLLTWTYGTVSSGFCSPGNHATNFFDEFTQKLTWNPMQAQTEPKLHPETANLEVEQVVTKRFANLKGDLQVNLEPEWSLRCSPWKFHVSDLRPNQFSMASMLLSSFQGLGEVMGSELPVSAAMANMELLDEHSRFYVSMPCSQKVCKMSKFSSTDMAPT